MLIDISNNIIKSLINISKYNRSLLLYFYTTVKLFNYYTDYYNLENCKILHCHVNCKKH
jgi:hypothetical protein